jgi:FlaA1/EpsC-like NDP-sugar epimerase
MASVSLGERESRFPSIYPRIARFRPVVMPVLDSAIWALTLALSTFLRYSFDEGKTFTARLGYVILITVGCQLALGWVTQLYRIRWRIGSFEEIRALAKTVIVVTVLIGVVNVAIRQHIIPASAIVASGAVTLVVAQAVRSAWRLSWERKLHPTDQAERAVVFGAGQGGLQVVRSLLVSPTSPYVPVALLDDDPAKHNLQVRHLRVTGGLRDLAQVAKRVRAQTVIVAIPSAGADLIRDVSEIAAPIGLTVRVLPPVDQILSTLSIKDIRPVTPEDLLGRRVIETEMESIVGYVTGRRVLVTGAGGSIGSELCRQLSRYGPSRLVMLDRDDSAIHQVQLSIDGRALLDSRTLVVCDIRDPAALDAVFAEHRPEVVFHAAALKHLPLLEMWPAEGVKTNVIGTQNVVSAAVAHGIVRFVNISTDKAANPTSVLGYTKRLAERLTAAAGEQGSGIYLSVRFGNVLGSRGSVLTTFRHQIEAGGPLTVTHPDVTRYFMTVQEAVELVIQAGAVGKDGEVLVLDMGEPVRIADVAKRLALESERPIRIVYTGLRPGEKLHEDLFSRGEHDRRPVHPLISHAAVPALDSSFIDRLRIEESDGANLTAALRDVCIAGTENAIKPRSRTPRQPV